MPEIADDLAYFAIFWRIKNPRIISEGLKLSNTLAKWSNAKKTFNNTNRVSEPTRMGRCRARRSRLRYGQFAKRFYYFTWLKCYMYLKLIFGDTRVILKCFGHNSLMNQWWSSNGFWFWLNGDITGDWRIFETVTLSGIVLPSGNDQILKLEIIGGDFNLNWVRFQWLSMEGLDVLRFIPVWSNSFCKNAFFCYIGMR